MSPSPNAAFYPPICEFYLLDKSSTDILFTKFINFSRLYYLEALQQVLKKQPFINKNLRNTEYWLVYADKFSLIFQLSFLTKT